MARVCRNSRHQSIFIGTYVEVTESGARQCLQMSPTFILLVKLLPKQNDDKTIVMFHLFSLLSKIDACGLIR